jgi:AcrR family transcriptional regulator
MKKRNTPTKQEIKKSFIQLLQTKGFEGMTVSDIAREASINRGTFYLHYLDKYDLMDKLEKETIYDLEQILLNDTPSSSDNRHTELIPYDLILKALEYVRADFAFISALSGKNGDPRFSELVKDVLGEMVDAKMKMSGTSKISKPHLPEDYATEILLSSVVSIIMLWIRKGGLEEPNEIAAMIEQAKKIPPCQLLL